MKLFQWKFDGALQTIVMVGLAALTMAYGPPATAVPIVGLVVTATPVVDPDGAGPLAPVALPAVPAGAVVAGGYIRYDAVFSNTGADPALNTMLAFGLPASGSFVGAIATGGVYVPAAQPPAIPFAYTITAGVTVNCTVNPATFVTCIPTGGSLAAGASGTLTVFIRVAPSVTTGTILTGSGVINSSAGTASGNVQTTVAVVSDLAVTNVDSPDPVTAGGNVTNVITATNNGPSNSASATMTFPLDANTTFVSASLPSAGCTTPAAGATGTVTCTIASGLAVGVPAVLTVISAVNPGASGSLSTTATVSGPATDPTGGNNSATASTAINVLTLPVTGVSVSGGTIDCASPVAYGTTTTCIVTPDPGRVIASISGCGAQSATSPFTTAPITAACTVVVTFVAQEVPTLQDAVLVLLALMMAAAGALRLRRRR